MKEQVSTFATSLFFFGKLVIKKDKPFIKCTKTSCLVSNKKIEICQRTCMYIKYNAPATHWSEDLDPKYFIYDSTKLSKMCKRDKKN